MTHDELVLPDGRHTYRRGAAMLAMTAESFGLEVSMQQKDDWSAMFGAIYKFDGIIDSDLSESERTRRFNILLHDVTLAPHDNQPTLDCSANCQLCVLRQNLTGQNEYDLVEVGFRFEDLFDLSIRRRNTSRVSQLAKLCVQEGQTAATLLYMPLQTGHERKGIKFNHLLGKLGAAGTLIDTVLDLEQDYDEGLCRVAPSRYNQVSLFLRGLPLFTSTIAAMPPQLRTEIRDSFREVANEAKLPDVI